MIDIVIGVTSTIFLIGFGVEILPGAWGIMNVKRYKL